MVAAEPRQQAVSAPLRAGGELGSADFRVIRRAMVLEGCKWDPQVGDAATLAPFPLIMPAAAWRRIAGLAESLARELMQAEAELLVRPSLHGRLALPSRQRRVLRRAGQVQATAAAGRILRFDFHWTDDGWRISEVNSDVPGGFTESSLFARLMARRYPGATPPGDPAKAWADTLARGLGPGQRIALLAAPGFMEDQQITAFLGRRLAERGMEAHLIGPRQMRWVDGRLYVQSGNDALPMARLVRFYQAEWLARLPLRTGWPYLFLGGKTPVGNPAIAALTESKRFPLVWRELAASLPTWRALLPETRDPRDAPWRHDDGWLVKSAFCNTGDTVAIRSLLTARQWARVSRSVWLFPGGWIAQRRFSTLPLQAPAGEVYPCIGVYTIDGRAAGCYGRISRRPWTDYTAVDVAVLIEGQEQTS